MEEKIPQMDAPGLGLEVREVADRRTLDILGKIGQALAKIYAKIPEPTKLPSIFRVEVTRQPSVSIQNLNELEKYFKSLEQKMTVWAQAMSMAPQPKIDFPKQVPLDVSEIVKSITSLQDSLGKTKKSDDSIAVLRSINDNLSNLVNRPVLTTPPVTNININPLEGFIKTTSATVGTTPTALPTYGQLFNRRSLQIYNNSANTIWLGGSDVTTSNGIPVASGSYSSVFDAGYNMVLYGIASQANNNVRVIEVSRDQTANVQE